LRLLVTFLSAGLAFFFLDARVSQLDLPGIDWALQFTLISFVFTLFAVGGFAHATNIVDGFNGLAGVVALIYLGSIAYVASIVGDTTILWSASIVAATMFGFLVLNYPKGLIFLGDGGAYLIGFLIAELAVMLVHRNTEVSPWFALTLLSYPIFETFFSMYRKRLLRRQSPGEPDGLHLHMLIHKRLVRGYGQHNGTRARFWANAMTSPYLWALALCSAVPAILFWSSTAMLQLSAVMFAALYLWLYWRIVRFKAPTFLVLRRASSSVLPGGALEEHAEAPSGPGQ
jgi:UDP-N-acetylmuramyl pentapeptide phosphotransferase/UDP-N-acetylglucosamine-1-phosphate transferase